MMNGPQSCFPAGTLVHTLSGVQTIEQIRPGDQVLSKGETGLGAREYRRVVDVAVHEHREVMLLYIGGLQAGGSQHLIRRPVTPDHLIWLARKGWTEARSLKATWPKPQMVESLSGPLAVAGTVRLYATQTPGVAWLPASSAPASLGRLGAHMDVKTLQIVEDPVPLSFEAVINSLRPKPEHRFRTDVYSIEIEGFHTYYVGQEGVWVHDQNALRPAGDP
jgi:transcription-repair coupling factor (superfamily II helicase)